MILNRDAFDPFGRYKRGYRQGQIDALNGVIKVVKVTHPDQTVTWERIEAE